MVTASVLSKVQKQKHSHTHTHHWSITKLLHNYTVHCLCQRRIRKWSITKLLFPHPKNSRVLPCQINNINQNKRVHQNPCLSHHLRSSMEGLFWEHYHMDRDAGSMSERALVEAVCNRIMGILWWVGVAPGVTGCDVNRISVCLVWSGPRLGEGYSPLPSSTPDNPLLFSSHPLADRSTFRILHLQPHTRCYCCDWVSHSLCLTHTDTHTERDREERETEK